jgi:hypothetical protein
LYTKIPHQNLIERLKRLIDFVFEGGDKKHIIINAKGNAYWGNRSNQKTSFSNKSLKLATEYLITNCHFRVGNCVMRQIIGIPMGIDPAPFWANLFLYSYEEEFISKLIHTDKSKARHFHSTRRFIDDLGAINDGGEFGRIYKEIYPPELDLKLESTGNQASFLNLDIQIVIKRFVYKLYDKRDDFPFFIVRMPHKDSNICQNIFYSSFVGEFLRIGRSTLLLQDFLPKAKELLGRMRKQGAEQNRTTRSLRKIILRHPEAFSQLGLATEPLIDAVTGTT